MLEFPTKRSIHLRNKNARAAGFLKQLFENSTPTLGEKPIFVATLARIPRTFGDFCDTPSEKRKKH